jgi:hypothetical protein
MVYPMSLKIYGGYMFKTYINILKKSLLATITFSISFWVLGEVIFQYIDHTLIVENKFNAGAILEAAIVGIIFGIVMFYFNKRHDEQKSSENN